MNDFPLGDEWTLGADGIHWRRGARVLLFDAADQLLLIRAHDWGKPDRSWWFLPGGGVLPNEHERDAASRELLEETGFLVEPARFEGPVARRDALFDFHMVTCRQYETFFLARHDGVAPEIRPGHLDQWEASYHEALRWWPLDELERAWRGGETLYPYDLIDFSKSLVAGWDGSVRELSPQ